MAVQRQIIALGGGGFSMEPENPLLDKYILKQSPKRKPAVSFIPTASGESASYIERFYESFEKHYCKTSHLSLFKPPQKIDSYLLSQDIIYVGGGNTKSMLALWKEWKLDQILRKAWRQGIVLCGISAGSICWFQEGLTDSIPDQLQPLPCLGLLRGSNCPHYDGEPERQPRYERLIRSGRMMSGLAADDGVALHYIGTKLEHVVSSRPGAAAYLVAKSSSGLKKNKIEPRLLTRS